MDSILRLNEFFVEGGKQDLSHVLLHITEPSTPEEMEKGYFFALCEVNDAEPAFIRKLQDMIDEAENDYYELPEARGIEKDSFEQVLEKLNSAAFTLEKVKGTLHCIVGAIHPSEIVFSYFGNPHLLLFYKNKSGNYERMDLVKGNGDETGDSEDQLFSQIIQGKLSPNDFLFAGTPHIIDFFSHDRLEKIITSRSAMQSSQHLEKVLSELKNGFSFGGMIINLSAPELSDAAMKKPRPLQTSSTDSLQELFDREENTANTLSPSIIPKLDKLKGILGNNPPEIMTPVKNSTPLATINSNHVSLRQAQRRLPEQNLGDKLAPIASKIWAILKIIGSLFLHLIVLIYSFVFNTFRTMILLGVVSVNYQNRRATIIENWRQSWKGFKENIRHLPLMTKLMLIGSVILGIGFLISILYIRHNQRIAAAEKVFTQSLKEIKNKRDSIQSALSYKNDELAISELRSATQLLPTLKCETKEQKTACETIKEEINNLGIQLRKVSPLNTTLLTTFSLPDKATHGLVRVKNKIIAYSDSTSTLFVYDMLSGESKKISTYPSISGFTEAGVPKENDFAIFFYNKKQLMQLNPDDLSFKLVDISFPTDKAEVASFVVYNRRLYTLDNLTGMIFRHDSIKTGYGQGQEWLKDKSALLKNGFDLAIDGDLFVSRTDGKITKFTSGVSQPFSLLGLDPELSAGARLWTYTDIPYLYILEPSGKRLIVFEKNGHLVGQYTHASLTKPTGMVVDPANKTVYLLDSGKLLKAPLAQ